MLDRLLRKFKRARTLVPAPVDRGDRHERHRPRGGRQLRRRRARGARHPGEARHPGRLHARQGLPVHEEVEEFLAAHERIFVVEQNRDAQLRSLLTLETDVPKSKLHSILHYSGLPMTSKEIVESVLAELGDAKRASLAASS